MVRAAGGQLQPVAEVRHQVPDEGRQNQDEEVRRIPGALQILGVRPALPGRLGRP